MSPSMILRISLLSRDGGEVKVARSSMCSPDTAKGGRVAEGSSGSRRVALSLAWSSKTNPASRAVAY
eukprot:15383459-Alexandrium_andersonii.AAC.1